MTFVLDTSAAFSVAFRGEHHERYEELLKTADEVIAPALFQAEVANVLWKYVKAGFINEENAKLEMDLMLQFVDSYVDVTENSVEALHESCRLNHCVYDMLYLTLARRNGATLLTLDQKLKNIAIDNGVAVI